MIRGRELDSVKQIKIRFYNAEDCGNVLVLQQKQENVTLRIALIACFTGKDQGKV
jgi:hypothetical protein